MQVCQINQSKIISFFNYCFLGNMAGPLNLTLHIELIDIKDHLSGNIISVPKQKYFSSFYIPTLFKTVY